MARRVVLGLMIAGGLLGGACVVPAQVTCDDGTVCPGDQVCTPTGGYCVEVEQATACDGLDAGAPCDWPTPGAGICRHGACFVPLCGDGELDPGEVCDDGNTASGDGCAAGCDSDETCGNGIVELTEGCDDGNAIDGDGCQAGCVAPRCGDGILDAVVGETCDDGNAVNHDACSRLCTRERLLWTERAAVPDGGAAAMAYDAGRGVVVLFGARAVGEPFGDQTWEWDGVRWLQRRPATSPPPRAAAMLAYDPVRRVTVLFGGTSDDGELDDCWLWDGGRWAEVLTARPSPRHSAAMAWDPSTQRLIVAGGYYEFGGNYLLNYLADVWTWDGQAWTEAPARALPVGRSGASLVYDTARGQLLLAGGSEPGVDDPGVLGWDGAAWATVAPAAVLFASESYAYDAHRGVLTALAGGVRRDLVDGGWVMVSVGEGPPQARLVYDGRRGEVIAHEFYGVGATWRSVDSAWTRAASFQPGPAVELASATYDAARGEVVVFGGYTDLGLSDETWRWDGAAWATSVGGPSGRFGAALGYDSTHARVVLFGGGSDITASSGDTWLWDGASWQARTPAAAPSPRQGAVIVDDPAHGGALLLGGMTASNAASAEAWRWDGETWLPAPPMPGQRGYHGAARDEVGGDVLLFGGIDSMLATRRETWRFDGETWTELDVLASPSPRDTGMTWDAGTGEWQVMGGVGNTNLPDLWTFAEGQWRRRSQPAPPPARSYGVGAAHRAEGETVVVGGRDTYSAAFIAATWALRYETDAVEESCTGYSDPDGDGAVGCDDEDCAAACAGCGDDTCGGGETCWLCPGDCGPCADVCGDGVCGGEEGPATCVADCRSP
jgi:cysteine-rich repeat protein